MAAHAMGWGRCEHAPYGLFGDNPRLGVAMFLKVLAVADAINHGEKAGGGEGGEDAVPAAGCQVDALCAVGEKGAGGRLGIKGDDDEEGVPGHRDEGLAAVGVTLDQIEGVGQAVGLGLEDRDAGAGIREVEFGAVVVAFAEAGIDQAEITRRLQHIAEGGEGGLGQGFGLQSAHDWALRLGRAAGGCLTPCPATGAAHFTDYRPPDDIPSVHRRVGYLGTEKAVRQAGRKRRGRAVWRDG